MSFSASLEGKWSGEVCGRALIPRMKCFLFSFAFLTVLSDSKSFCGYWKSLFTSGPVSALLYMGRYFSYRIFESYSPVSSSSWENSSPTCFLVGNSTVKYSGSAQLSEMSQIALTSGMSAVPILFRIFL